jgi:hypothetical protein
VTPVAKSRIARRSSAPSTVIQYDSPRLPSISRILPRAPAVMLPPVPPSLSDVAEWERLADEELAESLRARGLDDGLPLARLTRGAVDAALAAARVGPDETIAVLPPLSTPATAAGLAVCSVLAGCDPETFPVVVAAVRGTAEPSFNGLGVFTTTGSAAVVAIVNGPAAAPFNAGSNLLGPGNRANSAVGRALGLVARAIGGAVPGVVDMATMGQPGKAAFCLAENVAESPWEPFHVARGVRAEQSAVTVFAASGTAEVTNAHAARADEVLDTLAAALFQPGSLDPDRGTVGGGRCLVLVSPEWAALLDAGGLSRADVCAELAARADWPASMLPPSLRRLLPGDRVRAVGSPDDVLLVVAGGVGIKQTVVPGWSGGSQPVTVPVVS